MKKINDEIILQIAEDYDSSDMTVQQISEKYSVSRTTVYRAINATGINVREPKNTKIKQQLKTKKEKEVKAINSVPKFSNIGCGKSLICGLVSERHNMPINVELYIYEKCLNSSLLFNFEEQYRIAKEFILDNIYRDNKPNKDLILYCTGIQSALASVIKAAYDLKVNLILAHYDAQYNKYRYQVMWGDFTKSPITNNFVRLINTCAEYKYYNCSYQDMDDTIFAVTFVNHDSGIKKIYFCSNMADMYDLYIKTMEKMRGITINKFSLFADEFVIEENGKYTKTSVIRTNNN